MMRKRVPTLLLLLALLTPAAADAEARRAMDKDLWATINVCDPPTADNVVGIRASMPGNGTRQRMYMHFGVEWYKSDENRWVATGSSSPWVSVGSARYVSLQAGYSFQFAIPPPNIKYLMRGVVRYQWRARKSRKVLRRATRITRPGYRGVVGGVPEGRSDRDCLVSS